MDQTENHHLHNKKNLNQFKKSEFLRRIITRLLLSVSVFSLFFSHSSWSSLLHTLSFYFSTVPIKLFSHTLDKNCAFLLCNGLLVFLANYSGLFSASSSCSSSFSSSSSSSTSTSSKYNNYNTFNEYSYKSFKEDSRPEMAVVEAEVPLLEKEEEQEIITTQENGQKHEEEVSMTKHETTDQKFVVEEDKLQAGKEEKQAFVEEEEKCFNGETDGWLFWEEIQEKEEEEEEEEERGGNGMLSTEELNKKFDDFIRKMKEELRIEAQRQLIMV